MSHSQFCVSMQFHKNSKRIPKDFQKNSQRIQKEVTKNSQKIPHKIPKISTNITKNFFKKSPKILKKIPKNSKKLWLALIGRNPFRACLIRAQTDWTCEFPDWTGPDTKICRTDPAGQDWIRIYILPTKYRLSIFIR